MASKRAWLNLPNHSRYLGAELCAHFEALKTADFAFAAIWTAAASAPLRSDWRDCEQLENEVFSLTRAAMLVIAFAFVTSIPPIVLGWRSSTRLKVAVFDFTSTFGARSPFMNWPVRVLGCSTPA